MKLSVEPVFSLIDPRHVLIIPASVQDSILAQSYDVHHISTSMFRLFRWTKSFVFGKDSTVVPAWFKLPHLPFLYYNPSFLHRIGNSLGNFLRTAEATLKIHTAIQARICIEMDVSQPLPRRIWIGDSKEYGFWQSIKYECNIAFCTKCGLLGHVAGICRKGATRPVKNSIARKDKDNVVGNSDPSIVKNNAGPVDQSIPQSGDQVQHILGADKSLPGEAGNNKTTPVPILSNS